MDNITTESIEKKEFIRGYWKLESQTHDLISSINKLKNSSVCNCHADRQRLDALTKDLTELISVLQDDRELIEKYKDDPLSNATAYGFSVTLFNKTMSRIKQEVEKCC